MVQKHKTRDVERSVVQRKSTQAVRTQSEHKQSSPPANVLQRTATKPPAALKPADILALQRTAGNRAVQRMLIQRRVDPEDLRRLGPVRSMEHLAVDNVRVHNNSARAAEFFGRSFTHRSDPHFPRPLEEDRIPHEAWHAAPRRLGRVRPTVQLKLAVGPANDHYEQEADRVAASVMSESGAPQIQRQEEEDETIQTKSIASTITPLIQRQELNEDEENEAEDTIQTKPLTVQRQEADEDENPVQLRSDAHSNRNQSRVESGVEHAIERTRGGGQPLPAALLGRMEKSFGADFSGVRVHADSESDSLNRSLHARAFTTGQDLFFNRGEYNPESRRGQELIAHELTHVVQQNGGTSGKRNLSLKRSTGTVIQRGVWDWLKGKFGAAREYADEQRGEFKKDVVDNEYGNVKNRKGELFRRRNYNEDLAPDVLNYALIGAGGGLATARALGDKGQAIKDIGWGGFIESTPIVSEAGKNLSAIGAASAGVGIATSAVDAYKGLSAWRDKGNTKAQQELALGAGLSGLGNVAQQTATTAFHTANNLGGTAVAAGAEVATGAAALLTGAVDIGRGAYGVSKAKQNIARLRDLQIAQDSKLIAKAAKQAQSTQEIRKVTSMFTVGKGVLTAIGGGLLLASAATPLGWLLIGVGALIGLAGAVKKWLDKKKRREEIVMALLEFSAEQREEQNQWNKKADALKGGWKVWRRVKNYSAIKALPDSPVEKAVKAKGFVSVDHYYSNYISRTADDLHKLGVDQRKDLEDKAKIRIDKWSRGRKKLMNADAVKDSLKTMSFSQIYNLHNCGKLVRHVYGDIVKLVIAMGLKPNFGKGEPKPEKIGKALHE